MKVLLIWPTQENPVMPGPPKTILNEAGAYPPIGLVQLATNVRARGNHEIRIIDMILENLNMEKLEKIISEERPDAVGITVNTLYLGDGYNAFKTVKKVSKDIITIAGGPHVCAFPKEAIGLDEVDIAFYGEADFAFSDLLDRLSAKKPVEDIPGVITKRSTRIPGKSVSIENLNDIPVPDRRLLDYKKYNSILSADNPITIMMTSRGCPYKCAYCPAGGTKMRARSVESMTGEVESCLNLGIENIFFFDELFTFNKKRVNDICAEFSRRKLRFFWHIRARINDIDEPLLELLAKSGCRLIQFGIESGTERIQSVMNKNLDLKRVEKVISMTRKAGILAYGNFMIGSPTETEDEIMRTIDFSIRLKLDFAVFAITMLLPGTDYFNMAVKKGYVKPDMWETYAKDPSKNIENCYWPGEFSKEKLNELCVKAYKSFYMRPGYVLNYLSRIATPAQVLNQLKSGLNVFKNFK
jgi:radical SAM superfamily enzyme YgiQ (UPF0313 family)